MNLWISSISAFNEFEFNVMLKKNWCDTIAHHILHSISFFVILFVFSLHTFSWWRISFLASYIVHRTSFNAKLKCLCRIRSSDSSFSRRPITTLKYIYIHISMCTSVNVTFFLFLFWNSRMKLSLKLNVNHFGFQFNYKI